MAVGWGRVLAAGAGVLAAGGGIRAAGAVRGRSGGARRPERGDRGRSGRALWPSGADGGGGHVEQRSVREQCLQHRGPVREQDEARGALQKFEEGPPGAQRDPRPAPQVAEAVEHGVEGEGQHVEHRQQVRQAVLPVSEVVYIIPISELQA